MKTPIVSNWKGDGKERKFKYLNGKGPTNNEITVIHTRGGLPRKPPIKITRKSIIFKKPPQRGDMIIAIYTWEY